MTSPHILMTEHVEACRQISPSNLNASTAAARRAFMTRRAISPSTYSTMIGRVACQCMKRKPAAQHMPSSIPHSVLPMPVSALTIARLVVVSHLPQMKSGAIKVARQPSASVRQARGRGLVV